jgi:hypothetical protein
MAYADPLKEWDYHSALAHGYIAMLIHKWYVKTFGWCATIDLIRDNSAAERYIR